MSQVSTIWQLYLFYGVLVGIGMGGSFVPLVSIVTRWFVKRRGMITGMVLAGISAGTVIMPPLARWLISSYGWRISYIIVGSIALIFVIGSAQFLKRDPGQLGLSPYGADEVKKQGLDLQDRGFSFREASHTLQFWLVSAMYFCYGFILLAIMVHIAPHATELGISATNAANILAVIGGIGIIGRITMGTVGDRIGSRPSFIIAFILVSVALFWVIVAEKLWMLYLFAIIFGFGYGGLATLGAPLMAGLFGLRAHGAILGIATLGFSVGGAIGPILAGRIFDITTSYNLAFLTCGGVGIIGLILTLLLRPAQRQDLMENI